MVYEYYENTGDLDFVKEVLSVLDDEFQFWHNNRTIGFQINGQEYEAYQYNTPSNVPRPESYGKDMLTAGNLTDKVDRRRLFKVGKKKRENNDRKQ